MTPLPDFEILHLAAMGMITPYSDRAVRLGDHGQKIVSWGLSSFGYDMRLAPNGLLLADQLQGGLLDVKQHHEHDWRPAQIHPFPDENPYVVVPAHGFLMGYSLEYWKIPNDIIAITMGKSTYARTGIIANITPMEPGWEGHLTIEISNTAPLPNKVYLGEGIAQAIFFRGQAPVTTYADRKGKYQSQGPEVVLAKV